MSSDRRPVPQKKRRLGYWLAEKKIRKLNFEEFETICINAGVEVVKLDLDTALEQQGPFDVILHKLTDQIARSQEGCHIAQKQIERFQKYVLANPDVVVVDPIENIMKLFDRRQQYMLIQQCSSLDALTACKCFAPSFAEVGTTNVEEIKRVMAKNNVQYPIVSKPIVSHGSSQCHQMTIVFGESGLKDIEIPSLLQTFVNHNARLFKIFSVGDQHFIVERPSIKNFYPGNFESIFFNSNDVSKPDSWSFLNEVDESEIELPVFEPDRKKLTDLALAVQQTFGLDLLGIDVIIENKTGHYAIIDINTFPGYEDVPEFFPILFNLIQQKLDRSTTRTDLIKLDRTKESNHLDV